VKERYRFNAFVEIENVIFFIGRMQIIAIQPKAHEDDFDAQFFFKE
jgi:hypothetical protein